jgi:two-component system, chemotaxis family, sensor kinase CheA
MNPLLEQFLSEARDFLQGIAEKLMELENDPGNALTMNELFRLVHTLKGNSGLFEFPDMTQILHAGEDLMDAVRDGRVEFSQELADRLLDAMDFVSNLVDEIQANSAINPGHEEDAKCLAELLRQMVNAQPVAVDRSAVAENEAVVAKGQVPTNKNATSNWIEGLLVLPEAQRMALYRATFEGNALLYVEYIPEEECFFKGEDPFYQVRQIPEVVWSSVRARENWPERSELDAYRCNLVFRALTASTTAELNELFRYTPEQVSIFYSSPLVLALPIGDINGGPSCAELVAETLGFLDAGDHLGLETITRATLGFLDAGDIAGLKTVSHHLLELVSPDLWLSSVLRWLLLILEMEPGNRPAQRTLLESLRTLSIPAWLAADEKPDVVDDEEPASKKNSFNASAFTDEVLLAFRNILQAQREVLTQPDSDAWSLGRLNSAGMTLLACHRAMGRLDVLPSLEAALAIGKAAPLLAWLDAHDLQAEKDQVQDKVEAASVSASSIHTPTSNTAVETNTENKFGRRAEDFSANKTLKVDQTKIDRMMGLIGEMVVAKNSLPYLAGRAEKKFGVRELARDIKTQYEIINRIAEAMQDAIMQVRMMPVSFIFQRFPRLVRDTSRKLGKEVKLVLEGETTEADKNIIEALADPLIHIVRNSLDHGIETPMVRRAAGKPEAGVVTIRAFQDADRVCIEISDDGKGIDPAIIKRKAYEKGIIDESLIERMSDQEAVNLVFSAGFSTVDVVSDLSGRGVGMDVVRNAVEKVNGSVSIESIVGIGTTIRLSLPLSMAVTSVMIIESDKHIFGMPMDLVEETVRVPKSAISTINNHHTTLLRDRIVPLLALNDLLAIKAPPRPNAKGELATLVVHINDEQIGILVDDFREPVDIILKPMIGILGGQGRYAGSALLGDGSVLMVLNPRKLVS